MRGRTERIVTMAAAAVYLLVVVWLLAGEVLVRGDDFGYLESTAETIRQSSLVRSEWLGPFNLLLPWVGSAIYAATHSFWWATSGFLVLVAVVNFVLVRQWLEARGPAGAAVILAFLLCPVMLNKSVDYTGVALSFSIVLAAALCWRKRQWEMFFVLALLATANRQSSICLFVFPIVAMLKPKGREFSVRLLMETVVALGAVGGLWLLQPATYARAFVAEKFADGVPFLQLAASVALYGVCLLAIKSGFELLGGRSPLALFRENLRRPLAPILVTLLGVGLVWGETARLYCETVGLDPWSTAVVCGAAMAGGWLQDWRRWPPLEVVAFVASYGALIALRGAVWDYYLVEPGILIGVGTRLAARETRVGTVMTAGLVAAGFVYAWFLSGYLDRLWSRITLYEQAFRQGSLTVREASEGPFGYLGWKLFPWAQPQPPLDLSHFLKHVEGGRTFVVNGQLVILPEGRRLSIHPTREILPMPAQYRERLFPLNDVEWRAFVARTEARP